MSGDGGSPMPPLLSRHEAEPRLRVTGQHSASSQSAGLTVAPSCWLPRLGDTPRRRAYDDPWPQRVHRECMGKPARYELIAPSPTPKVLRTPAPGCALRATRGKTKRKTTTLKGLRKAPRTRPSARREQRAPRNDRYGSDVSSAFPATSAPASRSVRRNQAHATTPAIVDAAVIPA